MQQFKIRVILSYSDNWRFLFACFNNGQENSLRVINGTHLHNTEGYFVSHSTITYVISTEGTKQPSCPKATIYF